MIFVNDFTNCLRSSQGNVFADDTICYTQGTELVQNYLQSDLCNDSKWYRHNKLSLYIEKSGCTCMLGTRQRIHNNLHMEIILDG